MRQQAGRDRSWLEHLFDEHGVRLRGFAIRRVGPDDADDIVAEVFATTWRRRADVPEPALPWLYQTARHLVLHHHRSTARRNSLKDAVALGLREQTVRSAEEQASTLVESVLAGLDDTDAEVLRLTVWEQLTPSEIARVLDLSPGAVRNRLMRARRHARELYEAADDPLPQTPVPPCPTHA